MSSELKPCPFCSKTMMLRSALWPSEGDADAIIHADPTDCPMLGFSDGSADGSIIEKWNCSLSNEDDFPSDGSCVRCGSVPRNANGLCNTCLDEDAERLENTRTAPVAPVSPDTDGKCGELVTVAWESMDNKSDPNDKLVYEIKFPRNGDKRLVYRSQADELLAAERAEKEEWKRRAEYAERELANSILKGRSLEADNAAKAARMSEVENSLLDAKDIARNASSNCIYWRGQTEALEAKLAAAKSTIESMVYVYEVNLNNHNDGEDYDIYVEACGFIGRRPQL